MRCTVAEIANRDGASRTQLTDISRGGHSIDEASFA
jgi:hypothetical protein